MKTQKTSLFDRLSLALSLDRKYWGQLQPLWAKGCPRVPGVPTIFQPIYINIENRGKGRTAEKTFLIIPFLLGTLGTLGTTPGISSFQLSPPFPNRGHRGQHKALTDTRYLILTRRCSRRNAAASQGTVNAKYCGSASSLKSKDFSMRLGPAMLRTPPLLGFFDPTKKVNNDYSKKDPKNGRKVNRPAQRYGRIFRESLRAISGPRFPTQ